MIIWARFETAFIQGAVARVVRLRVVRGGVCRVQKRGMVLSFSLTRLCKARAQLLGHTIEHGVRHFPSSFVFRLAGRRTGYLLSDEMSRVKVPRCGFDTCAPFTFARRKMTVLSDILRSAITVGIGVGVVHTFIDVHRCILTDSAGGRRVSRLERHVRRLRDRKDGTFTVVGRVNRRALRTVGSLDRSAQGRLSDVCLTLSRLTSGRGARSLGSGRQQPVKFVRCSGRRWICFSVGRWAFPTGSRAVVQFPSATAIRGVNTPELCLSFVVPIIQSVTCEWPSRTPVWVAPYSTAKLISAPTYKIIRWKTICADRNGISTLRLLGDMTLSDTGAPQSTIPGVVSYSMVDNISIASELTSGSFY